MTHCHDPFDDGDSAVDFTPEMVAELNGVLRAHDAEYRALEARFIMERCRQLEEERKRQLAEEEKKQATSGGPEPNAPQSLGEMGLSGLSDQVPPKSAQWPASDR